MKTGEAIAALGELKPNDYTTETKLAWLSELDGRIVRELLSRFDEEAEEPVYGDTDEELLVGQPYTGIYIDYMAAKVDFYNNEFDLYNNDYTAFNALYGAYEAWYIRRHRAISTQRLVLP